MHTFAQKPKASKQSDSTKSSMPGRALSGQNRDMHPILHLQRTIGNQTVQRLLQANPGSLEAIARSPSRTTGFKFEDVKVIPDRYATQAEMSISTAPPKLPPSPKPQKGEKPLGKLAIAGKAKQEDIYASFVTRGVWWFNGGTPTLSNLYPTELAIPLSSFGKGNFKATVVKGSNKLEAKTGGTTVAGKNLAQANFKSKGPSKTAKDVMIEIQHTPSGAKKTSVFTVQLEVRAPRRLQYIGTDHQANGSQGFKSVHYVRLFDNFKQPMPYMDVNEDFDTAKLNKSVSQHWKNAFAARKKGSTITRSNSHYTDDYAVALSGAAPKSMVPKPSNPRSPLGTTKVGEFKHRWYAGSQTTGKGVLTSRHVGVFFTDHGGYTKMKSPV